MEENTSGSSLDTRHSAVLGPSPPDPVGGEIAGHYFQAKVPERREGDLCLGVGASALPPQRPGLMWDYRQLEVLLMSHRWLEGERASGRAGERAT